MAEWFDDTVNMEDALAEDTSQSNDNDPFGFGNMDSGMDDGDSYGDNGSNGFGGGSNGFGGDSNGFDGGSNGFGGSGSDNSSGHSGFIGKIKDSLGSKKFGAIIAILIGTVLLIVLAIVFGSTPNDDKQQNNNKQQQQNVQQSGQQQQTQQGSNQQSSGQQQQSGGQTQQSSGQQVVQGYQVSTTGNTWSKISSDDLNTANATIILEDTFTIKAVTIYADIMNGYALRAEASGTLEGRNNSKSYSTTIPLDAALTISAYLQSNATCPLKVSYKVLEKNSTVFVYDIELK